MTKWTFIPSQDGSPPELRTPDGKDPFCLNDLTPEEADENAERIVEAMNEIEGLREMLASPPKHNFWGAGEPDCPREIKAGNGELHTLRCKVCGLDSPRDEICRTLLTQSGKDGNRG